MLVKGGRSGMDAGNRTYELASQLDPIDDDIAAEYASRVAASQTPDELREVLSDLVKNDYNIVGSHDYVFHSARMIDMLDAVDRVVDRLNEKDAIAELRREFNWCFFTRGCNLRDAVIRVYGVL